MVPEAHGTAHALQVIWGQLDLHHPYTRSFYYPEVLQELLECRYWYQWINQFKAEQITFTTFTNLQEEDFLE